MLVLTSAVPCTVADCKLIKKNLIHASRDIIMNTDSKEETGKSQMGRGHWVTDIWAIQLQQTLNLKLTRLLSHSVQSVLSFWHHARCIVRTTREFPSSKDRYKPVAVSEAVDSLIMGKESRTCGLFSKLGLEFIHLYLLIMHMYGPSCISGNFVVLSIYPNKPQLRDERRG